MATTILEIVSPERLLLSEPVDMAEIPATEGDIGVLPGHAPMIVTLRGGTIRVHQGGAITKRLFVMGGFAEITADRCTVLADEAIPAEELSATVAAERVAAAEAAYNQAAGTTPAAIEATMTKLLAAREMATAAAAR